MTAPLLTTLDAPTINTRGARLHPGESASTGAFERTLADERTLPSPADTSSQQPETKADSPADADPDAIREDVGPSEVHDSAASVSDETSAAQETQTTGSAQDALAPATQIVTPVIPVDAPAPAQRPPIEAQKAPHTAPNNVASPAPVLASAAGPSAAPASTDTPFAGTSATQVDHTVAAQGRAPVTALQAPVRADVLEQATPPTEPIPPQPTDRSAPVTSAPQTTTDQRAQDPAPAANQARVSATHAPTGRASQRVQTAGAAVRAETSSTEGETNRPPIQANIRGAAESDAVKVAGRPVAQTEPVSPAPPAAARAVLVDSAVQLLNSAILSAPAGEAAPAAPSAAAVTLGTLTDHVETTASGGQSLADAKAAVESAPSSRIVRGLMTMLNQRGGVMNMRLNPPDLGDLQVRMAIVRGTVSAEFLVSTRQAHVAINASLATLRSALESQGLAVERLSIHTSTQHTQTDSAEEERERQDARDPREEAGGGDARRHTERDERDGRLDGRSAVSRALFADDLQRLAEAIAEAA